jgi:hypothetical protein
MRILLSLLLLCTLTLYNAENSFYKEYAMFKDDDSESDNNSEESSSNSDKS